MASEQRPEASPEACAEPREPVASLAGGVPADELIASAKRSRRAKVIAHDLWPQVRTKFDDTRDRHLRLAFAFTGLAFAVLIASLGLRRSSLGGSFILPPGLNVTSYSPLGADEWMLHLMGDVQGYYVDIGAFSQNGFSHTRLLDERGWSGICADPMPRAFEQRSCGYVPRPIGQQTGDIMSPPAGVECSEYNANGGFTEECAAHKIRALGIADLLDMVEAPEVIDFISVSVRGMGMQILEGFPWDKHCARYWVFELNSTAVAASLLAGTVVRLEAPYATVDHKDTSGIAGVLVAHRCRSKSSGFYLWAACFCSGDTSWYYPQQIQQSLFQQQQQQQRPQPSTERVEQPAEDFESNLETQVPEQQRPWEPRAEEKPFSDLMGDSPEEHLLHSQHETAQHRRNDRPQNHDLHHHHHHSAKYVAPTGPHVLDVDEP